MAAHTGTEFVQAAARYVGVPYVWGGSSPSGFDCSGLVYYVLSQLGISAPRTSQAQYAWAKPVSPQALQPGDLVFLNFPGESGAGHVMIWLGGNKVLQAPSTGQRVKVSSFNPQAPGTNEWGATVVGYGRVPGLAYKGEATAGSSGGGGGVVSDVTGAASGAYNSVTGLFSGVTGAASGAISGAESVSSFLGKLLDPSFWIRVLEVVGGFVLVMLGLYLLTRSIGTTDAGAPDVPVVRDLAPPVTRAAGAVQGRRRERHRRQAQAQIQPHAEPRRKVEVSEAAERRAAIRARAERAEPSNEIPF